jgi:hypothetical protein
MSILPRWQHRGYFVRKCETECHYVEIEWTKCVLSDGPVDISYGPTVISKFVDTLKCIHLGFTGL